ncbi:MAG: response regulator transcription factor [Clostridia bacterium]|nr:response regulator transcription factor [Clostridia bacterium]
MAKIVILESEGRLCDKMCKTLIRAGHQCYVVETAADALAMMQTAEEKMLTVISTKVNWTDSYTLLTELQKKEWPVLFITRNIASADHLKSLYRGECAVMPVAFDNKKLVECVAELFRTSEKKLTVGALAMDVEEHKATLGGKTLELTAQEFALLQALMQSPNAALTREQLLKTAWGYLCMGETRTVDVHVQRLRRKIGINSIETIYRLGYKLSMA